MMIKWISWTQYVDLDTGEVLTQRQVKDHYTVINKTRKTKVYDSKHTTRFGHIVWIHECKRTYQRRMFEDGTPDGK